MTNAILLAAVLTAPADGFAPLFNGKDLSGWTTFLRPNKEFPNPDPKQVWTVADGVLKCTGKPNGYVATAQEYGDYVLRVEWRYPAGAAAGNSGVLLHCQSGERVWPHSIEAQMKAGFAGDVWLNADDKGVLPKLDIDGSRKDAVNKEGRHYFRLPDAGEKPIGEWNRFEISCTGGAVKLVLNGRLVNEAAGGELKKGRIALQSEGSAVEFRGIEIKVKK